MRVSSKSKRATNHMGRASLDFNRIRVTVDDGLNPSGGESTLKAIVRRAVQFSVSMSRSRRFMTPVSGGC